MSTSIEQSAELDKVQAKAIMNFVNTMIGAFESGFVGNKLNLHDLHSSAFNHVKDNYNFNAKRIHEEWGQDVFEACRAEDKQDD